MNRNASEHSPRVPPRSAARSSMADTSRPAQPPPVPMANRARLRSAMDLLQGTSPPPRLLARANARALRMLRRTIRASEEARQLLHDTPRMDRRFVVHRLRQVALSSAAVIAMVILRMGMLTGLEEGRRLTELLAQTHVDRHIYGDLDETDT